MSISNTLLNKLRVGLFTPWHQTGNVSTMYDNELWSQKTTGPYAGKTEVYGGFGFNYNPDFDLGKGWKVYYNLRGSVSALLSNTEKAELESFISEADGFDISIVVQNLTATPRKVSNYCTWQKSTWKRCTPLDLGDVWTMMGLKWNDRLAYDNEYWPATPSGPQIITTTSTVPYKTQVLDPILSATGYVKNNYFNGQIRRMGWGNPSILNSTDSSRILYSYSPTGAVPTSIVNNSRKMWEQSTSAVYFLPTSMNLLQDSIDLRVTGNDIDGYHTVAGASHYGDYFVPAFEASNPGFTGLYQTKIHLSKTQVRNLLINGTTISGEMNFPIVQLAKNRLYKVRKSGKHMQNADSFNYTIALVAYHRDSTQSDPKLHYKTAWMVFDRLRTIDLWDIEHQPAPENGAQTTTFTIGNYSSNYHLWVPGLPDNVTWSGNNELAIKLPAKWIKANCELTCPTGVWVAHWKDAKKTCNLILPDGQGLGAEHVTYLPFKNTEARVSGPRIPNPNATDDWYLIFKLNNFPSNAIPGFEFVE